MLVRENHEERRESVLAMLDSEGWRVAKSILQRRLRELEQKAMSCRDLEGLQKLQAQHGLLKELAENAAGFLKEIEP